MEELSKSKQKQLIIDSAVEEYASLPLLDRSIKKISRKYGINYKTLTKYLKLRNIEINNYHNSCHFNYDFFDTIDTEEKAYWLGFMYADGYISSKRNYIGLGVALKDIDHLQKYNLALNYRKGLNVSQTHQFNSKELVNSKGEFLYTVRTLIKNKNLWEALNNKGCVPNKSLILQFPKEDIFIESDKYSKNDLILHFIRGYFDGDGTLGLYQHSKKNLNLEESLMFVGTKQFLTAIQKYLGDGFLMQKSNCNKATYRLSYSTKKAFNAAKLMYENASIYLDRKYKIYLKMCRRKIGEKR